MKSKVAHERHDRMLRHAARRAIGRVGGTSPFLGDVNVATLSRPTTASTFVGNPATARAGTGASTAGAPRWFAKPARRAPRKVKSSASTGAGAGASGGEKGKALQPVAEAWTEVLDARTGKTYWQGGGRAKKFADFGATQSFTMFVLSLIHLSLAPI